MDSPVSAQESFTPEAHPRRLSALYQYHNAPEVAPAHGLEYDDTIYPMSDKFSVIREHMPLRHHYTGKHAYENENKPPKIIFGMKVRTFLVVAAIMVLVVVGAAVGGAVGGRHIHQGVPPTAVVSSSGTPSPSSTPTATTTHTFTAATPTYTPLSDCPTSNGTTYTSSYLSPSSSSSQNQTFTKYCSLTPSQSTTRIINAFVYSFSDCINVCASYNDLKSGNECTVAFYSPGENRPTNCWVAATAGLIGGSLQEQDGVDAAILMQSL